MKSSSTSREGSIQHLPAPGYGFSCTRTASTWGPHPSFCALSRWSWTPNHALSQSMTTQCTRIRTWRCVCAIRSSVCRRARWATAARRRLPSWPSSTPYPRGSCGGTSRTRITRGNFPSPHPWCTAAAGCRGARAFCTAAATSPTPAACPPTRRPSASSPTTCSSRATSTCTASRATSYSAPPTPATSPRTDPTPSAWGLAT
mmetsp:Transcript_74125/g.197640  ORF Transcript_74125/g.197640 Transcript_74125/m.197640 type:complete len:202 (-) Transcript_74125:165-770(-)